MVPAAAAVCVTGPFVAFVLELVCKAQKGNNTGKRCRNASRELPCDVMGEVACFLTKLVGFPGLIGVVAVSGVHLVLRSDRVAVGEVRGLVRGDGRKDRVRDSLSVSGRYRQRKCHSNGSASSGHR